MGEYFPDFNVLKVRYRANNAHAAAPTVLEADQARHLLDSIKTDNVVGLRDRALIGVMVYSFARVSAVVGMNVMDYYPTGKRYNLRLLEKGGKHHEVPAHHNVEEYLDAYIAAAGIADDLKGPLFRSAVRKTKQLTIDG